MKSSVDEAAVLATPDGFATAMLGMSLYPRQREVLRALAPAGAVVSFRSCNEGGKTRRVICAAVLWQHRGQRPQRGNEGRAFRSECRLNL